MILYELNKEEVEIIKDLIENFIYKANKETFKEIDKKTDIILEKLNKPIVMNQK